MIYAVTRGQEVKQERLNSYSANRVVFKLRPVRQNAGWSSITADFCYTLDFVSVSSPLTTQRSRTRCYTIFLFFFFFFFQTRTLTLWEWRLGSLSRSYYGRPVFLLMKPGRENGSGNGGYPSGPCFSWYFIYNGTLCFPTWLTCLGFIIASRLGLSLLIDSDVLFCFSRRGHVSHHGFCVENLVFVAWKARSLLILFELVG